MDAKLTHLTLVHDVIARMGRNSFLIKGWSLTLVSAIFVLGASQTDFRIVVLGFLPASMFWLLDGYYLHQERLFRKLYDSVRAKEDSEIDFSMETTEYRDQVASWGRVLFSRTIFVFHGTFLLVMLVVVYFSG